MASTSPGLLSALSWPSCQKPSSFAPRLLKNAKPRLGFASPLAGVGYPVSPGHTLIIARRPVTRFQELTGTEKARLLVWIDWTQEHLAANLSPAPDGFNLGLNDGPAAGQTMPQLHFHVIPRYNGDVPDPRGGIRHVIPGKARYWQ